MRVLGSMRGETDASAILSALRGGMEGMQRPSDLSTAAAIMGNRFEALELEAQNPVAYPSLPPLDTGALRSDPYRGLTESALGNSSLPSYVVLGSVVSSNAVYGRTLTVTAEAYARRKALRRKLATIPSVARPGSAKGQTRRRCATLACAS